MEKKEIIKLTLPSSYFEEWNEDKSLKCVMVCHDQDIDRRILQQVAALKKINVKSLIIALSHKAEDVLEKIDDVFIHRIGLSKIIPDCPAYWFYQKWHYKIGFSKKLKQSVKDYFHKINWNFYKFLLLSIYRCPSINNPIPFDFCFASALNCYEADFFIAHDLPALKASVDRAKELSVPVAYDSHEYYYQQKVFSAYQKKLMQKRENEYIKECDLIITINETFSYIFKEKTKKENSIVIFNAHKFHNVNKTKTLHELIHKNEDEKIILFQGGLLKNRNIENLIHGFSLLQKEKVNLVFMGPSDIAFKDKLARKYVNLCNKSLFFLESIPQDLLLNITSTATFGVIPYMPCDINTKYCTPNKFFEFIQAELPILYNSRLLEVTKLANQVKGGCFGYDLSSPKLIKNAFEQVLIKISESDRLTLSKAKEIFSWENEEKKFLSAIQKTMEKK